MNHRILKLVSSSPDGTGVGATYTDLGDHSDGSETAPTPEQLLEIGGAGEYICLPLQFDVHLVSVPEAGA